MLSFLSFFFFRRAINQVEYLRLYSRKKISIKVSETVKNTFDIFGRILPLGLEIEEVGGPVNAFNQIDKVLAIV